MIDATTKRPPLLARLMQRARGSEHQRLIKFGVVGLSGVVVNQGLLWLGVAVVFASVAPTRAVALSSVIAIGVSIITNFLLNDAWTWGDRAKKMRWIQRLSRYVLVASVAGVVQWVVLQLLVGGGLHYLIANIVGIGAGIVINYAVNNWWTFRAIEAPDEADGELS